ncbi:MAG TPA: hypothetical protein VHG28_11300 [Longimicrobiaceae bacterium]|nr:hypothetical protein [Longimicrobiaceae bacterium]
MKPTAQYLLIAILCHAAALHAQGVSEGKEGSSSIGVFNREFGAIQINSAENSAGLELGGYLFNPPRLHWYNAEISARSKDGIASLLEGGGLTPETTLQLKVGINIATSGGPSADQIEAVRRCQDPAVPDSKRCIEEYELSNPVSGKAFGTWLIFGLDATAGSYKFLLRDADVEDQVQEEKFFGPELHGGINFWNANILNNSIIGGFTLGIARHNNTEDLDTRELEEVETVSRPTGSQERNTVKKTTVYEGDYEEFTAFPLRGDLIIKPLPLRNLGLNLLARAEVSEATKPDFELGLGMLVLKDNNALTPVANILLFIDEEVAEASFWNQLKLRLVLNVGVPTIR